MLRFGCRLGVTAQIKVRLRQVPGSGSRVKGLVPFCFSLGQVQGNRSGADQIGRRSGQGRARSIFRPGLNWFQVKVHFQVPYPRP